MAAIGLRKIFNSLAEVTAFAQRLVNTKNRTTCGVETADYIICESSGTGLVLKSPNQHFWIATINNAGVVTWTDNGLEKP